MKNERWEAIERLFHVARDLQGKERAGFLERECGADSAMRRKVEALLLGDEKEGILNTAAPRIMTDTRIGPYEIVGWLGAGGMGEVYRARDPRLGREVAIKRIHEEFATDVNRVHRFEQEARAVGQLNHPNILAVYDVGLHTGTPYIVSELLEGESLRSRLQGGALPVRKALDYARQTAEGLAAAHDKGIVHRDLKPDNLFVTSEGRLKVLDFGLAKLTQPAGDGDRPTVLPTGTEAGTVMGTVGYMSPEQVRGESVVDHRSDIFSFGVVLYELITGRQPFCRETPAETMAAILNEDPPELPATGIAPALALIVSRCLEKTREARFQSARDLAFGLEFLSGPHATAGPAAVVAVPRRWRAALGVAVVVLSLLAAVASLLTRSTSPPPSIDQQFANAKYTTLTDWEGSEQDAAISLDGKFIAFLADRDGPFHVWLTQVGSWNPRDLTPGKDDERNRLNRPMGFSPDGSEIWLSGQPNTRRVRVVPFAGGVPRPFLAEHAIASAWSPDGMRLVYFTSEEGDPVFVADRTGDNVRQILAGKKGDHNHFPTWSTDGQWIYYQHFISDPANADLWRIPSDGRGTPERMTEQNRDVRYPTPIDPRTVLYVAHDGDGSGPWLWALDVERKVTHRVSGIGPDRYLSVAASGNGRRLVATVAKSTAALWSVPIADRLAEEHDVKPYPMSAVRALAPRFSGTSLFYLSSSGQGDGLWRAEGRGQPFQIWKGSDGSLLGPAAVSRDGSRVAVAVKNQQGTVHLIVVSADGAERKSLAEGIDVRGTTAWSPDAKWIVTGGKDAQGPGLFKIPVDGGTPFRLVSGQASDPVWSRDGVIVYAGQLVGATGIPVLAVRPEDGSPVKLPAIKTGLGNGRLRFLPDGKRLVYIQGPIGKESFWLLDMTTNRPRQIAQLQSLATISAFDISPDGKQIVFDRLRENSDIVVIDLPK